MVQWEGTAGWIARDNLRSEEAGEDGQSGNVKKMKRIKWGRCEVNRRIKKLPRSGKTST